MNAKEHSAPLIIYGRPPLLTLSLSLKCFFLLKFVLAEIPNRAWNWRFQQQKKPSLLTGLRINQYTYVSTWKLISIQAKFQFRDSVIRFLWNYELKSVCSLYPFCWFYVIISANYIHCLYWLVCTYNYDAVIWEII